MAGIKLHDTKMIETKLTQLKGYKPNWYIYIYIYI